MAEKSNSAQRKPAATQLKETDFANQKMGNNQMQGEDQLKVHNQRHAVPDVKRDADKSILETLEKTDKNVRARKDLNKGARSANK